MLLEQRSHIHRFLSCSEMVGAVWSLECNFAKTQALVIMKIGGKWCEDDGLIKTFCPLGLETCLILNLAESLMVIKK